MVNLAGKVLKSYEVKERIGAGGFGAVFRAEQAAIGREVAVKIILPEHANKSDFIRRFETEAQLVARLEHPHIVPLYDYWREPGGAYLVMRYLRGGSLRDSLEENGAWHPARVSLMLTQIASALGFAHANGVVHRDLKTDNILIDESGNSYLTDFGIAKDLGLDMNLTNDAILGTPAYLSPEQIRGETASFRSDIYSLGILLFEALTASKPFHNATPASILYQQLNEPLPDLRDFRSDLPAGLDDVLQRATAKEADLRFDSVLALAREFATVVNETQPALSASQSATLDVLSITQQELNTNVVNPYKGLRAFQTVDADDFFGRDELIDELMEHIAITGKRNDFLAVVGPSGSGKSSVVKAGLLPRIKAGALDHEKSWYVAEIVPGTHPMEELEIALLSLSNHEMPDLIEVLKHDERGLVRALKRILPEDTEFVLFVDQFEETFTLIHDNEERIHFLNSILNAVNDERSRIKVIITLRADFYDRPLLYADFGNLIRRNTELVMPMNKKELEASISAPAKRVGIAMESGLVSAIINDVVERPGALPLLQYALTELFERRAGSAMTLEAYHEIGGTTGALARRAEELFQSFNGEEQAATRQMFMRLVTLGEGTDDTRRRVLQSELLSLNQQSRAMPNVIEQFGKYRLLTFDHDPQTRSSTIEVAHEALIRQWERVRTWLDENREALRLHRRLTSATDEWNQARRDPSFLARGVRLQQFESMNKESSIALNQTEKIFLEMSVDAREERDRDEIERQEREQALEQRARQRLTLLAAMMAVAAVVGVGLALFAFSAQRSAQASFIAAATSEANALENQAETSALALAANARNAANLGDTQLALVLALESEKAYAPAPVEVLRALSDIIYESGPRAQFDYHTESVTSVDFSTDSQLIISSSVDGTVHVIDAITGEEQLAVSLEGVWINDAVIHPNNSMIAAAASNGVVYTWAYPSGEFLAQLRGHSEEVMSIDYSPDGNILASGSLDHNIILWDVASGTPIREITGHEGAVLNVVFSPDGSRIASSAADATIADDPEDTVDRTVRVWDTQTGEQIGFHNPNSGFVRALDFSPTGTTLTYAVWDSTNSGTVRVYSILDEAVGEGGVIGDELQRFVAHTTPITAVAFSADGSQIASVAWDRTVRIWDVDQGAEVDSFVGFGDRVLSMAYSPDGQSLALGVGNIGNNQYSGTDTSNSQTVWLWDVQNRVQIDAYRGHPNWVWTADISPDGTLVASGGGPLRFPANFDRDEAVRASQLASTLVRVWNLETQETVAELPVHVNTVDSVKFHPDGVHLLTSAWDSQIVLWDYANEEAIRSYEGHTARVYMLHFLKDGAEFISIGSDGLVIHWDTETGDIISTITHDISINGIDISADEQFMVVSAGDFGANVNEIYLYEIATSDLIRTFTGHEAIVNEVRYHPSGDFLVSTSWDGTIRVWNIATGREIRQFTGHASETFGIDFSADGHIMLTTSSDRTVRMWDWDTGEEIQRFSQHTDWIQEVVFNPDNTIAVSAGQDNAVRIWRINRDAASLVTFAEENRYIRPLSCSERDVYRLETIEACS